MTEQELVERAKRGDETAFEALVTDNEKRIYNLCRRLVGNPEDAAELTQEAFLNAWRGLGRFQGESSFSTWVYRLATNVCIDFLRRQARRREVAPVQSIDDEELSWTEPADWEQDPHRQLERAELNRAVSQGLERLPDHHRQVLVMRELSGLSYQEIGDALALDLGTVKSRIARARLALRKILLEDGNFSDSPTSKPSKGTEGR